jgi:hypothetical protein
MLNKYRLSEKIKGMIGSSEILCLSHCAVVFRREDGTDGQIPIKPFFPTTRVGEGVEGVVGHQFDGEACPVVLSLYGTPEEVAEWRRRLAEKLLSE